MQTDPAAIVDKIYEAALMPQLWVAALEDICAVSRSASGVVLTGSLRDGVHGIGTRAIDDVFQQTIRDPHWADSPRAQHVWGNSGLRQGSFFSIADLLSTEEVASDSVGHVMGRIGLGFQAGTVLSLPNGDRAAFTFERRIEDGAPAAADLARLDALRPHLARAALTSARLATTRAESMVSALDAIHLPAALLTSRGRALAVNPAFEQCNALYAGAFERIVVACPVADALLQEALHESAHVAVRTARSIAVASGRRHVGPSVLHLIPVCGAAHDVFVGAAFLLIVSLLDAEAVVPGELLLQGLFHLTPKEAGVAAALTTGLSLKEVAAQQGIRFGTARTHLEHIFQKTDTHDQTQLVVLLRGAEPFSAPPNSLP